jgi:cell division protein ZapE
LQRQRILPAIALIEDHLDVMRVDSGVDYRLRYLERAPTYLDSSSPHTLEALRQRFQELAGGGAAPATLMVEGRPIHAVATGPDIAWFEFSELCDGPRSQNDYIELARLYGIMLVDEFYDRGVKTVVSAAAPPAQLYRGERLQFEFQRAASRLIEMQTPGYLAGRHHA